MRCGPYGRTALLQILFLLVGSGTWCGKLWTGRPGVLRFMGLQRVGRH